MSNTYLQGTCATGPTRSRRSTRSHRQPGEFVFEPNARDSAEDGGVLMGVVDDQSTGRGDLVLHDAATLETVATAHPPTRVPEGIHGNWLPTPGRPGVDARPRWVRQR